MYTYKIMQDGFQLGVSKGKHNAFEFIQEKLKYSNQLGIWNGLKCETDTSIYTIERADND